MDDQAIYCRRLGHHLTFAYCRSERGHLPCAKIRDCWIDKMDIDEYLAGHFKNEEIRYLYEPPPPKMYSLVELIEKARARNGE